MNDRDQTFSWLEKAFAVRSAFLISIASDPKWDDFRTDSRFEAMLGRIGLPVGRDRQVAADVQRYFEPSDFSGRAQLRKAGEGFALEDTMVPCPTAAGTKRRILPAGAGAAPRSLI